MSASFRNVDLFCQNQIWASIREKGYFCFWVNSNFNKNNVFCRKYSLPWNQFLAMNCLQLQLSNMFHQIWEITPNTLKECFFTKVQSTEKHVLAVLRCISEKNLTSISNRCLEKWLKVVQKRTFSRRHGAPTNVFWLVLNHISKNNVATICNPCL